MNFSKLTVTSFLAQAILFLGLAGTNKVLCAATSLEQQQQETLDKDGHYTDKTSNLRGNRFLRNEVDIASSGNYAKRFLVKFKDHDRFMAADMQLQSDPHQIMSLPDNDVEVMTFESEEEIQHWEEREDVEYIEPDHEVHLLAETVPYGIKSVKALSVSDEFVSNQKVCIIDSGYDINHPDLQSSRSIVTGQSLVLDSNWETSPWSEDENGHGTHVAGTIAAIGGNDRGVVGVNRNGQLRLHIVKIFDRDGNLTWTSDVISAVEQCAKVGATVVNMSFSHRFSQTAKDTMERIFNEYGILLVAAAGNDGTSTKIYPASYPSVMSVAGVDSNNKKYAGSHFNDQVDIAAPAVDVLSTLPGGGYGWKTGTSMASPHVAGVAALVWSYFPTKTAQQIRQVLESSAQDLGESGRDDVFGHGLVRADLAYHSNFIEYNDLVYLQNNWMDKRWLSGSRSGGNVDAITRDHLSNQYERYTVAKTYQWIVRSTPGNGSRQVDYDPKKGQCLKYGDIIFLQNNWMDKRWLSGARSGGNVDAITRDHLSNQYERYTVATTYQWIVRKKNSGDGSRP